ncbi:MAG TPA: hypothetical protein VHN14_27040 [Kofleriaceae bacterium]|nr:hypothetical protein [Kofleriaceae bacterium]
MNVSGSITIGISVGIFMISFIRLGCTERYASSAEVTRSRVNAQSDTAARQIDGRTIFSPQIASLLEPTKARLQTSLLSSLNFGTRC